MHIDEIAFWDDFVVPHFLEKHCPGQELILAAHHVFQQPKFSRQKLYCAIAAFDRPCQQIDFERADFHFCVSNIGRSTQKRFESRNQFSECKWFREIVIASCPQTTDAIVNCTERTKHQYRFGDVFLPHDLYDRETIDAGQHPVDDHCIGIACTRLVESLYSG